MELLTTKQASVILGVSRRRVIALIEQGRLKATKVSSVYCIAPKDLEAVRKRKNGRPEISKKEIRKKKFVSFADVAAEFIGSIKEGLPADLSTNKKYMEGYGTKNAEKQALKVRRRLSKNE